MIFGLRPYHIFIGFFTSPFLLVISIENGLNYDLLKFTKSPKILMELSEAIEKCRVDNVFLCEGPRQPQKGSLALIGHHLIFQPDLGNSKKASHEQELWVIKISCVAWLNKIFSSSIVLLIESK